MLSGKENKIMTCISSVCKQRDSVLITPKDLITTAMLNDVSENDLEAIMHDLENDGYFDLVYSERKGEKIYCITLLEKGRGYDRSKRLLKRSLLFKVGLSAALAVFSFLIGLLLKSVF